MRLQYNLKGQELFWMGGGGGGEYVRKTHITSAKREVPCGRGPGPAQGPWKLWDYLDALWCNLSLILDHLQFVWNLFITQNVIKLRPVSYCHIKMNKKRNKQQSLAGRIDKLSGPEFENPWSNSSYQVYWVKSFLSMELRGFKKKFSGMFTFSRIRCTHCISQLVHLMTHMAFIASYDSSFTCLHSTSL